MNRFSPRVIGPDTVVYMNFFEGIENSISGSSFLIWVKGDGGSKLNKVAPLFYDDFSSPSFSGSESAVYYWGRKIVKSDSNNIYLEPKMGGAVDSLSEVYAMSYDFKDSKKDSILVRHDFLGGSPRYGKPVIMGDSVCFTYGMDSSLVVDKNRWRGVKRSSGC